MKKTVINYPFVSFCFIMAFTFFSSQTFGQKKVSKNKNTAILYDTTIYNNLRYRSLEFSRGGRSAAVTGVIGRPREFYMGATGGGAWKTTNAGNTWENVSDGYFGGTIGAIDVSQSDPNIVYVGGGEVTVRGNVSHGYGMWKSYDAGKTWKYIGLKEGQYIPRVRIHPKNPDLVYIAVLGHVFGPNEERGIYRTKDGGKNWKKILFVNNKAGAVDLILDPSNPRIIYASTWKMKRTPYSLESGGEGSGLWKSTDGGDTWKNISRNKGLPKGTLGIIGVTVSPVNPDRVWAIIEADSGGLFCSDDGGETWIKTSSDRSLRQRAWYYSRIYADTQNEDVIYVLNVGFFRSKDGGKTFERIRTPHGDHHDLWIDPKDPNRMIIADDGGGQVSVDGGQTWTTYHNQPTAQFYRVITDNYFPYRIYAAQQDNSTIRISHRFRGYSQNNYETTAGGESGHIAPDPKNPDVIYGGSYGGYLERLNHRTGERRLINVWPDNPMGWGAKKLKYRFQWNFPVFFSHFDPNTLYCAANVLFKTTNEGQSWQAISKDLTRNDTTKMESSGGPITKDNTSVEYYGTIFAATESLHEPGVIWTGSDDGLIYITRDGGKNWENVTPPSSIIPKWTMINSLEPHPFEKGGLYVAATSYKMDDFRPYLYKTTDYGKTWGKITSGIDNEHFTRVIRADPSRKGLLFAGTESGMYISFDDGENWQTFQLNLPIVPITDLTIKDHDLIVATQGRSLWILDDITPLRQLSKDMLNKNCYFFQSREAYKTFGPFINFYLKNEPDSATSIRIDILETNGKLIRSFKNEIDPNTMKNNPQLGKLTDLKQRINRFTWDMRYQGSIRFPDLIMWGGGTNGPIAVPGKYKAKLVVNSDSTEIEFVIKKDPRSNASQEDLQAQFDFLIEIRDKLTEIHQAVIDIRKIKEQLSSLKKRLDTESHKDLIEMTNELNNKISRIEKELYQIKNQSRQDPLNYPIKLNNKLASLAGSVSNGDNRPTDQSIVLKNELIKAIDLELAKFENIKKFDLPKFNKAVLDHEIPSIILK